MITVHVHELRLFGYHGVSAKERAEGQDFLFDVDLEVGERGANDQLDEGVDYREVAQAVKDVSDAHAYDLVEALAAAVADDLLERFGPERVVVRVTKPAVRPAGLDATVGATVTKP